MSGIHFGRRRGRASLLVLAVALIAFGWEHVRTRGTERDLTETEVRVRELIGTPRPPSERFADVKQTLYGKLVPRNQAAYDRLSAGLPAIEESVRSGAIGADGVAQMEADVRVAARDNLIDESEVDAFLRKHGSR